MKRILIIILIMGVSLLFLNCNENNPSSPELSQSDQISTTLAKKPTSNIIGTMELDFVLYPPNYDFDPELDPVWVGTVDLEGYAVYGIRFFHLDGKDVGQASHFIERFEIYNPSDDVVLAGPDTGVTTLKNSKYRMNGEVDVANAQFEEWMGRNVHMSGDITWQNIGTEEEPIIVPATAPGTLRIN